MILLSRSEEIILLTIWKLGENAYGITIRDRVSKDTGHEWSFGAIYKPLKKLVKQNYVTKKSSEPCTERGGRSKYMYTLTPVGRKALKEIRKVYKSVWTNECELTFD